MGVLWPLWWREILMPDSVGWVILLLLLGYGLYRAGMSMFSYEESGRCSCDQGWNTVRVHDLESGLWYEEVHPCYRCWSSR